MGPICNEERGQQHPGIVHTPPPAPAGTLRALGQLWDWRDSVLSGLHAQLDPQTAGELGRALATYRLARDDTRSRIAAALRQLNPH